MSKHLTPKKRKKQILRRRRFLLFLVLFSALLAVCLFAPIFNIGTVEVRGNELITSEQILDVAQVPMGNNIFRINKGHIKKAVKTIPEIEEVKVSRVLPHKLRLTVTETPAVMYFPYLSGYVATNEKGRVLAKYDSEENLDLIKITGLEVKTAEIYEKISIQNTVSFDIMVDTMEMFRKKGLLPEIRSCHFDNLVDFYLYLKDGTKVIFGKISDMDYKLSVLNAVLGQVNRTEGTYIDLTVPERTVSGSIDPTPAPTAAPAESEETTGEGESEEASTEPSETEAPEETQAPEESEAPEETKAPEKTAAPKASQSPNSEPERIR